MGRKSRKGRNLLLDLAKREATKPSPNNAVMTTIIPQLQKIEIGLTEWTGAGRLRHPSFLGLRQDKAAEDVIREASDA